MLEEYVKSVSHQPPTSFTMETKQGPNTIDLISFILCHILSQIPVVTWLLQSTFQSETAVLQSRWLWGPAVLNHAALDFSALFMYRPVGVFWHISYSAVKSDEMCNASFVRTGLSLFQCRWAYCISQHKILYRISAATSVWKFEMKP